MRRLRHLPSLLIVLIGAIVAWNEWRHPARPRPREIADGDRRRSPSVVPTDAAAADDGDTAGPPPAKPEAPAASPEASTAAEPISLAWSAIITAPEPAEPTESAEAAPSPGTASPPAGAIAGDGSRECPPDYPIKGNASSQIYHRPGIASYERTIPEFCFSTAEAAEAAGFRPPRRG